MRAPARDRQRGFFDFSFPELVITFGVALVVLGPKKLPGLVQQVGRWVGRARHMARQFTEQLEQEVNSIKDVKPAARPAPEVGPVAPGTNPPEVTAANAESTPLPSPAEPETLVTTQLPPEPIPVTPQAVGSDVHPESQMYFAMNGSEPTIVSENPYAAQTAADDSQALHEAATTAPAGPEEAATAQQAAPAATPPGQPATVEVIFPHDHG